MKFHLHSRWRHFVVEGRDRANFLQELPPLERAKSQLDLAMIAVLLDAGAGQRLALSRSTGPDYLNVLKDWPSPV